MPGTQCVWRRLVVLGDCPGGGGVVGLRGHARREGDEVEGCFVDLRSGGVVTLRRHRDFKVFLARVREIILFRPRAGAGPSRRVSRAEPERSCILFRGDPRGPAARTFFLVVGGRFRVHREIRALFFKLYPIFSKFLKFFKLAWEKINLFRPPFPPSGVSFFTS